MRNPWIVSALLLVSLAACTSREHELLKPIPTEEAQKQRQLLVGRWYGEVTVKEGGARRWLMDRRVDGTYTIRFKFTEAGQPKETAEAGLWGATAGYYFTLARESMEDLKTGKFVPFDTAVAHFDDLYQIQALDSERFKYRDLGTGEEFSVKRVDASFAL
jgi:hypothetical protein